MIILVIPATGIPPHIILPLLKAVTIGREDVASCFHGCNTYPKFCRSTKTRHQRLRHRGDLISERVHERRQCIPVESVAALQGTEEEEQYIFFAH